MIKAQYGKLLVLALSVSVAGCDAQLAEKQKTKHDVTGTAANPDTRNEPAGDVKSQQVATPPGTAKPTESSVGMATSLAEQQARLAEVGETNARAHLNNEANPLQMERLIAECKSDLGDSGENEAATRILACTNSRW